MKKNTPAVLFLAFPRCIGILRAAFRRVRFSLYFYFTMKNPPNVVIYLHQGDSFFIRFCGSAQQPSGGVSDCK